MPGKPSGLSLSPFDMPSPALAHFVRVAGSQSGQDRLFMVYQYAAYIAIAVLNSKRLRNKTRADVAIRIEKLRATISDARVLYRIFGIFPIIAWAQSLNDPARQPKDKQLLTLQRLQTWSMLLYYPLEHTYYLAGKGVFNISPQRIGKIAVWSCRFWAAYVVLQIFHIRRSFQLLRASRSALLRSTRERVRAGDAAPGVVEDERAQLAALATQEKNLKRDCWVQAGYLPLTAHWSIPGGILPNNVWVGVCGTIAGLAQLKGVWQATA
ncbi:peroxisomal biogenesis factor 11 [Rhodotorula diobovata]|uniref:Peroxisomal biogenesis factor 11 n=1 Tax=Rhodotorula diobovata TaxID=5288 RepID=A0A5C5FSQ2_9BASI|nr:peroxisomal biogenesis factor 11 [Rhodotorula diobovata]